MAQGSQTVRFSPRIWIHGLPLLIVLVCGLVTNGALSGKFVVGHWLFHATLLIGVWGLGIFGMWLYLRSGIVRYEVAPEGLHVKRIGSQLYRWDSITYVYWNPYLKYVSFRARSGTIAFSSTDQFPNIFELVDIVHRQSGCELSPTLAALLPHILAERQLHAETSGEIRDELKKR